MVDNSTSDERYWYFRRPLQFLADVFILSLAFVVSYLPAVNVQVAGFYYETILTQLPFVVLVQMLALFAVGANSLIWRYVSIEDIKVFVKAALVSLMILLGFRFLLSYSNTAVWQVPVSVILIDSMMAFGGLLALRILRRFVYEINDKNATGVVRRKVRRKPALIVGAGRMGSSLVKEMSGRADAELEILGFVDDEARKVGGSVNRVKVLGTTERLPKLVKELKIEEVVLAIDQAQGKEIRRIMDICSSIPVKAQIVPSLNEIAHGRVRVSRIRDVEIEDLLGRDPVELNKDNLSEFLSGRVVLVTGAGGSIGSELVRQIMNFEPGRLILVERAEYLLFLIERELAADPAASQYVPLIADIGDEQRMRAIFAEYRPDVVFHAAAHKHVPLMEANAVEAVKNNIFATRMLGTLSGEFGVKEFVLISTDKAVNPTSVMGASKRIAEIVIQELDRKYPTKYAAVRFGNVLGSAGSVVPIFREQIRKGGPVSVTHPDMTRYFMTIPEAAQLVMQAGALGDGGEIYILDMGEPVRILDLAEDMIRLSGLTPHDDIEIEFTGIRKGEKLFEELEITGEDLMRTLHPKIFIGKIATYSNSQVSEMIDEFAKAVEANDAKRIRDTFNHFLPEASIAVEPAPTAAMSDAAAPPSAVGAKLGFADK
ncbi:MAG: polysaccharide biosynthesis protein [Acidobacteria bacterium]|nr:polysaccharide biosynthesis protein [Acidobacteriota bacterium]